MGWRCGIRKKTPNIGEKMLKLIRQLRWDKVQSLVLKLDSEGKRDVRSFVTESGGTCVHELVYFDAPFETLISVVDFCPEHVQLTDDDNRTPLFIASLCCASTLVISSLIALYPKALEIKDSSGRTPMIAACMHEHFGLMRDGHGSRYRQTCVIEELLVANSRMVLVSDKNGITALEHAILCSAGKDAITLLQRATAIEEKIKSELENTVKRSKMQNMVPLLSYRRTNGSSTGTTILPKNPIEWNPYKITPMLDERKNRQKTGIDDGRKGRSDPQGSITNNEVEVDFINAAVLQFIGVPQEDWGRKDSVSLEKVKSYKIWKRICEARENLEHENDEIPVLIAINKGENATCFSDLSAVAT